MVAFLENEPNVALAPVPAKVWQHVGKILSSSCTRMSIKHVGGEGQEGWERWAMKTHAGKDWVAALPSAGDLCRTEHLPPNWFGELRLGFST